jgi:hypothetical protein
VKKFSEDAVRKEHLEKLAEDSWFLLDYIAPLRWSLVVRKYLANWNVTVLELPPQPDSFPVS